MASWKIHFCLNRRFTSTHWWLGFSIVMLVFWRLSSQSEHHPKPTNSTTPVGGTLLRSHRWRWIGSGSRATNRAGSSLRIGERGGSLPFMADIYGLKMGGKGVIPTKCFFLMVFWCPRGFPSLSYDWWCPPPRLMPGLGSCQNRQVATWLGSDLPDKLGDWNEVMVQKNPA